MTAMCQCIYEWVEDPKVDGSHRWEAIGCKTYIAELEHELIRLSSADNPVLRRGDKAGFETVEWSVIAPPSWAAPVAEASESLKEAIPPVQKD